MGMLYFSAYYDVKRNIFNKYHTQQIKTMFTFLCTYPKHSIYFMNYVLKIY